MSWTPRKADGRNLPGKLRITATRFLPYLILTVRFIEGDDTKPRIGVWIMPDNSNEGMLEDFLLRGVPAVGVEVAREAVELAEKKEVTTFKDAHHSKAVIHTYLAWQDEPGRPLGLSVTSKMLSPETPEAKRFVAWLRKLFP